jgi:hypothetical protein
MPWIKVQADGKTCVHKKNDDGTAGESLNCYDGDDQDEKANAYMKALHANEGGEMQSGFIFTELSLGDMKMIDGLAAGTFTAMNGREVTFSPDELDEYINNTRAIIETTRTESGEVVGLPIDKNAHDHHGGAGWIVDLQLDRARNVIRFVVKWTQEGIDLIKGNIRRFFSPSTDPGEKVILGGSLTNWPATRDKKGKMLLRPVELSKYMKEIDMAKTLEELQADLDAAVAQVQAKDTELAELKSKTGGEENKAGDDEEVTELNRWMAGDESGLEELSRRAQEKAELIIRAERRKDKAVEFASMIVGGTKEKPFGLPIKTSRIVKLLLSLPELQAKEVQELIGLVWKNAVDFAEHGVSGADYSMKPRLSPEFAEVARLWVESGKPIKDWFTEMGESVVGKAEDYNLAEFVKQEA